MSVHMDLTPAPGDCARRARGSSATSWRRPRPWLCASCYECQVRCPREIKVTDVMYALKRRAIEKGMYPRRFPIPVLAKAFYTIVASHGRNSESRLVIELAAAHESAQPAEDGAARDQAHENRADGLPPGPHHGSEGVEDDPRRDGGILT